MPKKASLWAEINAC